jgi:hypothetical protein
MTNKINIKKLERQLKLEGHSSKFIKNIIEKELESRELELDNIETFNFIKDKCSTKELIGFCKGNIIKYITGESHKNGIEDLKQAKWYLDKLIKSLNQS